jgi:Domain of unknown function (DUF4190)/Septum formation
MVFLLCSTLRRNAAVPEPPCAKELVGVGLRFNPPPGWPPAPEGFTPQSGWQPDPSWPPPPAGWQLWVNENQPLADSSQAINEYGAPSGVAGPGPGTGPTSGWAIASFVLGLLSLVVLGVIFAFIALRKIKRLGLRGRGLAIAGLAMSGSWVLVLVVVIVATNAGKATRSATTGVITHRGHMNAFSLRVGDCFDNPTGAHTVNTVTAIPCDQPHNAQIYAKFRLTASGLSYPGTAVVAQRARSGCNARIGSVDKAITTNVMTVRILLPEETSWTAGRRTVSCMIVNPTATLTTSLLNSAPRVG